MNELRKSLVSNKNFEPREGQRELLRSSKDLLRCPSFGVSSILSKDTLNALEELGYVLKSIHRRMIAEGYEIVDGVVKKVC